MDESLKRVYFRGPGDGYEIVIGNGILAALEKKINDRKPDKTCIVINETVRGLHGDYLRPLVENGGSRYQYVMPDGETHKSYRDAEGLFAFMLENGFTRRSLVVAVGGGVTGDFAGYGAALYMRGIPVVQVPTTLLSMVDSSIGGKVAVNISAGKNIIGAFHQPLMVVSDTFFLKTLPPAEMRNGLTEALKHGLIGDRRSLDLFLKGDYGSITALPMVEELVYRSAVFKTSIVTQDETESGIRAVLNFGHTVGHAIESFFGYSGISHGEAVALGMKAELEASVRMGVLADNERATAVGLIDAYGLAPTGLDLNGKEIVKHMKFDKKNVAGSIRCVLLESIGKPLYNQPVDEGLMERVINEVL